MTVTIYHNPACSKSRQALELLRSRGVEPEIVLYLTDPPTKQQLKRILGLLDLTPRALIRTGEAEYRERGLNDPGLSDDQLLEAMVQCPRLIQRPIVLAHGKAALGRPPEKVLDIL